MSAAPASWITQQLVRYLSELSVGPDQRPSHSLTLRTGAERAAEAVDADAAAILRDGRVAFSIGFGSRRQSAGAIRAVAAGDTDQLEIEGLGAGPAVALPLGDPGRKGAAGERGHLVLVRMEKPFEAEEMILLRALARILSLSLRSVDAMAAERGLRRESERRAREALRDPLTGLANRALFLDRLHAAAAQASRREQSLAVLFMDLDGFKVVNDTLGHAAGDDLLRAVGGRLAAALRLGDAVARLGGDEFAVLVEDLDDPASALEVAGRVLSALREPFHLQGRELAIGASIGIAYGPRPEEEAGALLRDADLAMYRAKAEAPGSHRVFVPAMRNALVERVALEEELRRSIGRGGLACLYQPVVELATGAVVGVEALVRWSHPTRGMLSPIDFLGLARETGVIEALDTWVLGEACRQLADWRSAHPAAAELGLSVNVSGEQLSRPDLPGLVDGVLSECRLPPSTLYLEVSEAAILGGPAAGHGLQELASVGVRVAIDDFGTGYSSLGRLRDLPVHVMKVDRSFVAGVDRDDRLRALLANIVHLGHDLDLGVVVEGVETAHEHQVLRRIGCAYGQGYHYGRPRSAEDTGSFLLSGASPLPAPAP